MNNLKRGPDVVDIFVESYSASFVIFVHLLDRPVIKQVVLDVDVVLNVDVVLDVDAD